LLTALKLKGFEIGEGEQFIKPNDDVNKSQSSNDTFPTECTGYIKQSEVTIPGVEN
jgi:fumarate hydratase class II